MIGASPAMRQAARVREAERYLLGCANRYAAASWEELDRMTTVLCGAALRLADEREALISILHAEAVAAEE